MLNFKDTQVPEIVCPGCGAKISAAGSYAGQSPKPGDASLCAYCGAVLIFRDDLTSRLATPEEIADLESSNSEFLWTRAAVTRRLRARKARHN